jgi:hypothetical protein
MAVQRVQVRLNWQRNYNRYKNMRQVNQWTVAWQRVNHNSSRRSSVQIRLKWQRNYNKCKHRFQVRQVN